MMLTQSQLKTYQFIKEFMKHHQYAPTAAEIAQGIGIQSRGVVHRYLKALAESGHIRLLPNRHRNIVLNSPTQTHNAIPLMGYIAAGRPIEAVAQEEHIDFKDIFAGPERFALQIKGDSMIEEGIMDGDLVICHRSETAHNGQIVVALIDNQEATLKRIRFNPEEKRIILIPANPRYQPTSYPAERVQIQGIYIGLVRRAN